MWIALIFVMYLDGSVIAEAPIAVTKAQCDSMHDEFITYVRNEHDVKRASFRCIRV